MHDKNGNPIKQGDRVTIEAVISSTSASEDYCNVTLAIGSDEPHGPFNVTGSLTVNARQVELIPKTEATDSAITQAGT